MIERLMDMERSYGEPEYSKLSHQITQLRQALEQQLNQEGLADLERLTEAYIRQGNVLLSDGFAEGFWSAINLALEHYMQNHRIYSNPRNYQGIPAAENQPAQSEGRISEKASAIPCGS